MNETLAAIMAHLAQLFDGNMGWAILALALAVRLALLPLTLHLSRKMLANRQKMKALQPQVDAIKQRLAGDPKAMFVAISTLYEANGAKMVDGSSILGGLVQLPVFGLLYKAIGQASAGSFLWIRSLASPDVALTAVVLVLTAVSACLFPSETAGAATFMIVVQVVITAFILWKLSAGLGLYWVASAAVNAVQAFVLRFDARRLAAATVR
ncbi:membrane protein insertase YidC [Massilia sp. Dwa41.01b]|uniref:membrane protein insertase YidC n=1 Tax=unclassified Massilia TaxID=2609279 RepID=UPI0015FF6818|nr:MULTISPECIES: membrane protein insertase YidC [unclassified Massilia]QNA90236.1 membrane protein insertase YidC [Massilia sp. Dwa41.01b]QNB01128.1 membrane protein insertase YidC [Massilia sp. Se16.2.3]